MAPPWDQSTMVLIHCGLVSSVIASDSESSVPVVTTVLPRAIFLHLGKTGGGSLTKRLELWGVRVAMKCHPSPCPEVSIKADQIVVTVRDPVDRFLSAFNWRAIILCQLTNTESRQVSQHAWTNPNSFCTSCCQTERLLIHQKYNFSATQLAEALCNDDNDDDDKKRIQSTTKGNQAAQDLKRIVHARTSLTEWLPENSWDRKHVNVTVVVQEPGFSFVEQADSAILELVRQSLGEKVAEMLMVRGTKLQSNMEISESDQHSSAILVNRFGGEKTLSLLGQCCVARHHKQDYELLAKLRTVGCRGDQSEICRAAIDSIIYRRKDLLDDNISCQDVVANRKQRNKSSLQITSSTATPANGQAIPWPSMAVYVCDSPLCTNLLGLFTISKKTDGTQTISPLLLTGTTMMICLTTVNGSFDLSLNIFS